jgi:hypothetical protein
MAKKPPADVAIGKFDILATYSYANAKLDGLPDDEAKERGMVAAVMGAQARLGARRRHDEDFRSLKDAAEKKKKSTITAASFDRQVADKMGDFFGKTFLPAISALVASGVSYDEVKRLLKVPATWGAKIRGEQFKERVASRVS